MISLPRRRFTTDEFHTMIDAGVFKEDDRLELIKGEIVEMTPIGKKYAVCVRKLMNLFARHISQDILLDAQNPLYLSDEHEFYPDVFLLRRTPNISAGNIPIASDVTLLIEVSDSTLLFDRTTKVPSYALAAVPEVWIVDVRGERVLVHRNPLDGVYGQVQAFEREDTLTVAELGLSFTVSDIL